MAGHPIVSEIEYNELSRLVKLFKEKIAEVEKREKEWKDWLVKMEQYMAKGLFKKKYK